jgi:tetratricopeptide (TPR) repeat protein
MSKKRGPNPPKSDADLDPFARQVEQALDHFVDPAWLGTHSPLAAPYFLGHALDRLTRDQDVAQRGQALQQALVQAAGSLESELRKLLQITYFDRDPRLDNLGLTLSLNLSERTFYRQRQRAIQALALALNQSLLPPLRAEAPAAPAMIGREAAGVKALTALQAHQSVFISGPSGIGKTTLAAAVTYGWSNLPGGESDDRPPERRRVFWYTLRNRFNDQVASLLFALGYFLRGLGAAYTWRQLVAARGLPDLELILGLLRRDLNDLAAAPPLICIDEIETLQDEISDHVQIAHLLEALSGLCPMLLIGQRVILAAYEQIRLTGLNPPEFEQLLRLAKMPPLSSDQRAQLYTSTRGNPSLILLFSTLIHDGDDTSRTLQALLKSPSLEGLFNRLWRRLNEAERELLLQLAIFRNPAPSEVWQTQQTALDRLHQRGLIQYVGQGSVQMTPHFQKLAYERIPGELRSPLHLRAMDIYETRAEHLPAMYHAIEGGKAEWAIWHWFTYRSQEMERGQGAMALELLRRVSPAALADERDRTTLRLARAELLELAGQPEEAELELQAASTTVNSSSRAFARRLEGYVLEFQGRVEQALEKYRESLEALTGLPQYNTVLTHTRMSFLQLFRLSNVEQARKEALLARAKADAFLGDIEVMAGRYRQALDHLLSARHYIELYGHDLLALSRIYSYLGFLYGRLGEFDSAIEYMDKAIECDEQRGDEVGPLYDLMNRSTAYTLAGRYEQGYDDAQKGLEKADQLHHPYLIAGLAACAADACRGLMRWDEAEQYANRALNQEEEFFRAPTLLILGRIRLAQARCDESLGLLTAGLESAQGIEDRYTEAEIGKWIGAAHECLNASGAARLALERTLQIYIELQLPREIADVQSRIQALGPAI